MGGITSNPQVACIVLNWNNWQDSIECLDALQKCIYPNLTLVLVDNGSTNDSIAQIRNAHPDVTLLQSAQNLGFAGGNNIGIRYALSHGAEYIWLLNNDTKPAPDSLSALVTKAQHNRRIGAVASVCYYANQPEKVQVWAGARVNLWIGFSQNTTTPCQDNWFQSLYGASILIARLALEDVGLLDEGFFLYWEETEYCLRLRKGGWALAAAPDSRVLHKVNGTTGGNNVLLDRYFTASGLRILKLHSPAPYLAMFIFLLVRFTRRVLLLEYARCRSIVFGIQDYLDMLPLKPKIR